MQKNSYFLLTLLLFLLLFYYFIPFNFGVDSSTFLTIATFIFAIFTGFFISRQGNRYSNIVSQISRFDGELTSIYRQFSYISIEGQYKIKQTLRKHYNIILKENSWNYQFVHKSSTLVDIYKIVEEYTVHEKVLPSLKWASLERILDSLRELQSVRKRMVLLHKQRIPHLQWMLIYFLAFTLLTTLSSIPSYMHIFPVILKTAFVVSVFFVIFLLKKFDSLDFFESKIGESSAKDVLDILDEKK